MNGFKKNKNGTTKRIVKPELHNDQLGENASEELKAESYQNAQTSKKKTTPITQTEFNQHNTSSEFLFLYHEMTNSSLASRKLIE